MSRLALVHARLVLALSLSVAALVAAPACSINGTPVGSSLDRVRSPSSSPSSPPPALDDARTGGTITDCLGTRPDVQGGGHYADLPDVRGMREADAVAKLHAAGFQHLDIERSGCGKSIGKACMTRPDPGCTSLSEDIELWISDGN
jgi:hypothetical protein